MEIVDVAVIKSPDDAEVFESILSIEGIEYHLTKVKKVTVKTDIEATISVRENDKRNVIDLLNITGFNYKLIG